MKSAFGGGRGVEEEGERVEVEHVKNLLKECGEVERA